jgi:hypothetical protein
MNAPDADAARREIKTGFERLVLGVLRGLPPSEEPGEPPGSSQPAREPSSGGSPTSQTEGSSR